MVDADDRYDVVVAGGGPAGSAAATLVARAGHTVLLAERSPEPTFKIGESLMPAIHPVFERLGVLDAMRDSAFPRKFSVQFYGRDGSASKPFYFHEFDDRPSSQTWQVRRADFDQMLIDNAASSGAAVRRGLTVTRPIFDGDSVVGARVRDRDGNEHEVACRVLVDATGQSSLLARHLGLRKIEPKLRKVSYFTHYRGAHRDPGIDEGATIIFHVPGESSWFWQIPLPEDLVSVGLVGDLSDLVGGGTRDPAAVFDAYLERCPALAERLAGAERVKPVGAIRDFSYHSERMAGEGWILVGDAFGFIDPIYSTGVFLALKSGEMAADAIVAALDAGSADAETLGRYEAELRGGIEALRRLVYAFYDPAFSFADFLRAHPGCREPLVHMLMGNVFTHPMGELLAALDEWLPGGEMEIAS